MRDSDTSSGHFSTVTAVVAAPNAEIKLVERGPPLCECPLVKLLLLLRRQQGLQMYDIRYHLS